MLLPFFYTLMKLLVYFTLFFAAFGGNIRQDSGAQFRFDKKTIKFDKVKAGEILTFSYFFENTGTQPLIINNIKVTCGCTKAEWPTYPVLPGIRDSIRVAVNTKTLIGWQDRVLEVYSNAGSKSYNLRFKVMVEN